MASQLIKEALASLPRLRLSRTPAHALFRRVFWASIPFDVIAMICACLIRNPSQYLTNHNALKEGILNNDSKVHSASDERHEKAAQKIESTSENGEYEGARYAY